MKEGDILAMVVLVMAIGWLLTVAILVVNLVPAGACV